MHAQCPVLVQRFRVCCDKKNFTHVVRKKRTCGKIRDRQPESCYKGYSVAMVIPLCCLVKDSNPLNCCCFFCTHAAAYCYEEKGGCDVDKGVVKGHRVKGDCGRVVDTSEDADAMEGGLVVSKYREESKSIEDSKWLEAHVKFCTSGEYMLKCTYLSR